MQKKTECKMIKIHGNKILFVNNKLHGEVKNSNLVLNQSNLEKQMDPA